MANFEALIITVGSGQNWNASIIDPTTESVLATYKTGVTAQKGIALIGQSYLLAAQKEKNIINVYTLDKKDHIDMRMITPGPVLALAVSSDGLYCVAGIDMNLLVWQVSSGKLMAIIEHHLQPVSCVRFSNDGHFISGGNDGHVLVWSMHSVLEQDNRNHVPKYIWAHHLLQVTDIFVSLSSMHPRVATTSSDQTCKVYDLKSGEMLVSFVLDVALTTVVMDNVESNLFLGAVNGRIYHLNLYNINPKKDVHLTEKEKIESVFTGHAKQITSISTSMDGFTLLSGSYDNTVRLWNIQSKQCIRKISYKGPVLNAAFIRTPPFLLVSDQFKPMHLISAFQRQLNSRVAENRNGYMLEYDECLKNRDIMQQNHSIFEKDELLLKSDSPSEESKVELKDGIGQLQEANKQMYCFSMESVLQALRPQYK